MSEIQTIKITWRDGYHVSAPNLDDVEVVRLADHLRAMEQMRERIDSLNAELSKGDSWAWIRQKFEHAGRNYRWFTPRTDALLGTRYEVMGWLHCLFGEADTARTAWEICLEQQKRADEADAELQSLRLQMEGMRKPVTDEEWFAANETLRVKTCFSGAEDRQYMSRAKINAIIGARATDTTGEKK